MPATTTVTLQAPIRLRNAREHARLRARLRQGAELHNALAAFDDGIRRHNRRCFLRQAPDWQPGPGDWQNADAMPQDPDRLVRYPRYMECTAMLATALQEIRAEHPEDALVTDWTSDELRAIAHDYLRCRTTEAKIGRFRRSLRSISSRSCLRHELDDQQLRVHIGPAKRRRSALRATLPRPLAADEQIRSIRIVQVHDGHPRAAPSRWEAHVVVEGPARPATPRRARPRMTALDLGARRIATSDTGRILEPMPAPSAARAQQHALARKRRGSRARHRLKARLRHQAMLHARRRQQRITKHAALLAKEHEIVAIEKLNHAAMRARGGTHKRGVNRTLATAAPGELVAGLRRKLAEQRRHLVEVPAAWTTAQCLACGSRDTERTRIRVHCRGCGAAHDRDHAAAGNILLRAIAQESIETRNQRGPSGSAGTARKRRPPASECWRAHRASLARDPAGTSPERLRDRALRGLAQERWGRTPPERRCDMNCAPGDAGRRRIPPESRHELRA